MGFLKDKNQPASIGKQPIAEKMQSLEKEDLPDRIAWAARAVHKQLGPGFERGIYLNALSAELQRLGLLFERDKEFPVAYHGVPVGNFNADLLVEGRLLIRVGTGVGLKESDIAGMESCLRQAGLSLGILVEFSQPAVQLVRFEPGKSSG